MKINTIAGFKGFQESGVPTRGSAGAGAFDIRAAECVRVKPGACVPVRTQLQFQFPDGVCGLILPRSGTGTKGLWLANTVGLIDSDYRGEVYLIAWNRNSSGNPLVISEGDRIAQMIFFQPLIPELVEVEQFTDETARGDGGFGSTGT